MAPPTSSRCRGDSLALRRLHAQRRVFFVVGDSGTALHNTGSGWKKTTTGTSSAINAVWGSGPTNVFAAGNHSGGNWLHFRATHGCARCTKSGHALCWAWVRRTSWWRTSGSASNRDSRPRTPRRQQHSWPAQNSGNGKSGHGQRAPGKAWRPCSKCGRSNWPERGNCPQARMVHPAGEQHRPRQQRPRHRLHACQLPAGPPAPCSLIPLPLEPDN